MSVRHLLAATPAAAQLSAQSADAYALTTGRLLSVVAGVAALAGLVIGGLALARSNGRAGGRLGSRLGSGRRWATAALVAGLAGTAGGGLVVAVADGGPGSGSGIVGGVAALVIGLIATALGWLTLARSRRPVADRS